MSQNKIVITGTIASGKSSLSEILRKNGYKVIDSDEINKKLLEKDQINYKEIFLSFESTREFLQKYFSHYFLLSNYLYKQWYFYE